jgi:hypothetical protein
VTPGTTGRRLVLGSARLPLQEMVTLDYLYVANLSLWATSKSCCGDDERSDEQRAARMGEGIAFTSIIG